MRHYRSKFKILVSFILLFSAGCSATNHNLPDSFLLKERVQDAVELATISSLRGMPDKEKLTYAIKWLGMPVGTLTTFINGTKKINGKDAYVLEAIAKTNNFCSKIFKVNNRYVSYVDKENLRTLRHEVYRREGKYKKDAVTVFDHANRKAYYRNLLNKTGKVFDIPEGVHDFLSVQFLFRTLKLKVGDKIRYAVSTNEKNYQVVIMIKAQEALRLGGDIGKKKALLIQPYVMEKGKELKQGSARGYFSCEDSRPLLGAVIMAPIFTKITAFLSKSETS